MAIKILAQNLQKRFKKSLVDAYAPKLGEEIAV